MSQGSLNPKIRFLIHTPHVQVYHSVSGTWVQSPPGTYIFHSKFSVSKFASTKYFQQLETKPGPPPVIIYQKYLAYAVMHLGIMYHSAITPISCIHLCYTPLDIQFFLLHVPSVMLGLSLRFDVINRCQTNVVLISK